MIPESFHFLRPAWLWALALLAVFGWSWRRRSRGAGDWQRVCDPHLLAQLATTPTAGASRLPLALLAVGWTAACLALAGPTWERLPQASFREPARSVFVLTLGDSMNKRDVKPSRLTRARHKLLDALERTPGSLALVVVREEAFAVTPLTDDAGVLREAIPLLETRLMPGRTLHPARGLEEARKLLEPVGLHGARIVLVSDGADDDPDATAAAARALASDGASVSVLSVAGESEPLAALAKSGGGAFAALTLDDVDLDRVLAGAGDVDPTSGAALVESGVKTNEWKDMGAWLVWIPLLLAPFGFRKGWAGAALAVLCLQLAPAPARAGVLDAFERPDQRGARAFADGRFEDSARAFEDPAWQAAARYRAGDYEGASEALAARTDAVSQYNLGNALAKSGQLEAALGAYDRALAAAPADEDARFNRELVKKLLEQQKQQAQQPSQQGQQDEQGQQGGQGQRDSQSAEGSQQDPAQNDSGGKQGSAEVQDQGEGSQGSESPSGSDESKASEQGKSESEKAEDAGAEAEAEMDAEADAAREEAQARPAAADEAEAEEEAEANAEAGAREPDASRGMDAPGSPADSGAPAEPDAGAPTRNAMASSGQRPLSVEEQQRAQWMARLPDDPGGLLREKIRRDYQRKQRARLGEDER